MAAGAVRFTAARPTASCWLDAVHIWCDLAPVLDPSTGERSPSDLRDVP